MSDQPTVDNDNEPIDDSAVRRAFAHLRGDVAATVDTQTDLEGVKGRGRAGRYLVPAMSAAAAVLVLVGAAAALRLFQDDATTTSSAPSATEAPVTTVPTTTTPETTTATTIPDAVPFPDLIYAASDAGAPSYIGTYYGETPLRTDIEGRIVGLWDDGSGGLVYQLEDQGLRWIAAGSEEARPIGISDALVIHDVVTIDGEPTLVATAQEEGGTVVLISLTNGESLEIAGPYTSQQSVFSLYASVGGDLVFVTWEHDGCWNALIYNYEDQRRQIDDEAGLTECGTDLFRGATMISPDAMTFAAAELDAVVVRRVADGTEVFRITQPDSAAFNRLGFDGRWILLEHHLDSSEAPFSVVDVTASLPQVVRADPYITAVDLPPSVPLALGRSGPPDLRDVEVLTNDGATISLAGVSLLNAAGLVEGSFEGPAIDDGSGGMLFDTFYADTNLIYWQPEGARLRPLGGQGGREVRLLDAGTYDGRPRALVATAPSSDGRLTGDWTLEVVELGGDTPTAIPLPVGATRVHASMGGNLVVATWGTTSCSNGVSAWRLDGSAVALPGLTRTCDEGPIGDAPRKLHVVSGDATTLAALTQRPDGSTTTVEVVDIGAGTARTAFAAADGVIISADFDGRFMIVNRLTEGQLRSAVLDTATAMESTLSSPWSWIRRSVSAETIPTYSGPVTSTTAAPQAGDGYRVVDVASDDELFVRAEPDPAATALGSLAFNEVNVLLTGRAVDVESGRWLELVLPDGQTGWANGRFLAPPMAWEYGFGERRCTPDDDPRLWEFTQVSPQPGTPSTAGNVIDVLHYPGTDCERFVFVLGAGSTYDGEYPHSLQPAEVVPGGVTTTSGGPYVAVRLPGVMDASGMAQSLATESLTVLATRDLTETSVTEPITMMLLGDRARRASVSYLSDPARVVVDLRPAPTGSGLDYAVRIDGGFAVVPPNPDLASPASLPVGVRGWGRPFEASGIAQLRRIASEPGTGALVRAGYTAPRGPLAGTQTTTTFIFMTADWSAAWGEFAFDIVDVPPGEYELFVGWASPQDGENLGVYQTVNIGP